MKTKLWRIFAGVCILALMAAWTAPACAQDEPKEKPPMYSYVAFWNIPRAQWADMEKNNAVDQKILEKALADGAIVGYGNDSTLVHTPDGTTHDNWWSAMSMAALLNVLDKFYKSGTPTSPVLGSATRHSDGIFVSRFYNWRPGSYKGAYTRVAYYKLKPDAPENAIETISKHIIVPVLEKLLADGSIVEYEIDTEAIHTEAPGAFWVDIISTNADGLDKLNAALRDAAKAHPPEQPGAGLDGGPGSAPGFSVQLNCDLQVVPRAVARLGVRRLRFLTQPPAYLLADSGFQTDSLPRAPPLKMKELGGSMGQASPGI